MKNYLLITLVAVGLYLALKPSDTPSPVDLPSASDTHSVLAVKEMHEAAVTTPNVATPQIQNTNSAPTSDVGAEAGRKNMQLMLSKLAECTEIKNSLPGGGVEPTLNSILDSVQSDLGEPVIRSEDWNSTEVRLPDGSRRLIRIETVYEDDDIIKKAKYYQVTDQGLVPQELTREQAVNPSDSFLASLEKEGEVTTREKSERVFFQNGEEVTFTEKNGRITNSEIIRAGKSLKCGDYGTQSFRCQCF